MSGSSGRLEVGEYLKGRATVCWVIDLGADGGLDRLGVGGIDGAGVT